MRARSSFRRTTFCSLDECNSYENQDDDQDDNSAYIFLRTCSKVKPSDADLYDAW